MPMPGPMELVILLVIVLVIFGPGKLPSIGSAIGNGIREFRSATREADVRTDTASPPSPGRRRDEG